MNPQILTEAKKLSFWKKYAENIFNMHLIYFICNTATVLLLIFFTHSSEHYKPNRMMHPISEKFYDSHGVLHSNSKSSHKLVFMLIDGMSYRFLSSPDAKVDQTYEATSTLGIQESNELKAHLSIFAKMKAKYPQKTILEPAYHRSPTWTIHGVKSLLTGFLPPESVKDMLFKENKTYEILLDSLNSEKKSYFVGDVYWKDFIDQKSQKWKKVEFTNWFGSSSN